MLPEPMSSGYVFESQREARALAERPDGPTVTAWTQLAAERLLCAPTNWPAYPRPAGERPSEVVRVQADAAVNRMFIAACDRVGAERGVEWVGGSVIVDADGWPLAGGSAFTLPATLLAECDLDAALDKAASPNNDVLGDRRPELYERVIQS